MRKAVEKISCGNFWRSFGTCARYMYLALAWCYERRLYGVTASTHRILDVHLH